MSISILMKAKEAVPLLKSEKNLLTAGPALFPLSFV
jgi:hypothetical protein